MHVRTKEWYLKTFRECNFEIVKVHDTLQYGRGITQCDMFALRPSQRQYGEEVSMLATQDPYGNDVIFEPGDNIFESERRRDMFSAPNSPKKLIEDDDLELNIKSSTQAYTEIDCSSIVNTIYNGLN